LEKLKLGASRAEAAGVPYHVRTPGHDDTTDARP
jgi:hypothetical protein